MTTTTEPTCTYAGKPSGSDNWVATYDDRDNCTSEIHGEDPKHPDSWIATYDDQNHIVSKVYGDGRIETSDNWIMTKERKTNNEH